MKLTFKPRKPPSVREQIMGEVIAEINKVIPIHAHDFSSLQRLTPEQLKPTFPIMERVLDQPIGLGNRLTICEVIALWGKGGVAIPISQFRLTLPKLDKVYVEFQATRIAQIIADSITASDAKHFDDLAELTQDTRYGFARCPLPEALIKIKSRREDTIRICIEGLNRQDVIALSLIEALRRMKAGEAADAVRPYLESSDSHTRLEARKALKVFGVIVEDPKPVGIRVTRKRLKWETSVSFDPEDILVLLGMVNAAIDGDSISQREVAAIHQTYEEQEEDEVNRFEFKLTHQGKEIRVRFEMIDGDELYIFSDSKDLIDAINQAIDDRWE